MSFEKLLVHVIRNTQMKILHLACLNNDPEIQANMGPKCASVSGEPRRFTCGADYLL